MSTKRKSPVGVKIIACLLLLGSLAALALPWMKLAAEVGPNQTRMSPGEVIQNFAGLDAAAVLDTVRSELASIGIGPDLSALSDLVQRLMDGRFLPHEMGIACRDLATVFRDAKRLDLAGTMETVAYGVWGVFALLALLGFIALICQLTDHRGGMVPYFLLGALITGGLLFLRQTANDYLVRESASLLASYGMSGLIQYLGINLEIVKMGIGAYLCPFLALLSLLLMGIKKKAQEPRYEASPYYQAVKTLADAEGSLVLPISAKLESDIAELDDPEEKAMFMEELGLKESGLDRLIRASYELLGLISFLTGGGDECRAWTIRKGTKAPQAAGKIHTDFERGFIRAEVVNFDDLVANGTMQACKDKGLIRSEGKDYVMRDGDVVVFRFNV